MLYRRKCLVEESVCKKRITRVQKTCGSRSSTDKVKQGKIWRKEEQCTQGRRLMAHYGPLVLFGISMRMTNGFFNLDLHFLRVAGPVDVILSPDSDRVTIVSCSSNSRRFEPLLVARKTGLYWNCLNGVFRWNYIYIHICLSL